MYFPEFLIPNSLLGSPAKYLRRIELGLFFLLVAYALLLFGSAVLAASTLSGLTLLNLLALPTLPILVILFIAGSILICTRDPSSPSNPVRSQVALLIAVPAYVAVAAWHLTQQAMDPAYIQPEWVKPVMKLIAFVVTTSTLSILSWTGLRSPNSRTRRAAHLLRRIYVFAFLCVGAGILLILTFKPAGLVPMVAAVLLLIAAFFVNLRLMFLLHNDLRRIRKLGVPESNNQGPAERYPIRDLRQGSLYSRRG